MINISHTSLHYKEYGNKNSPIILFVHGGGVSGWMWDKQVKHFSSYHCIVPDLPGHGISSYEAKFSINDSANKLINLIEEKIANNGDKKIVLIGFSLGSQIIMQMISINPQIADLIIINSALVKPIPFIKKFIKPLVTLSFPLIKYRYFAKLQSKSLYISDVYFENYYIESKLIRYETLIGILNENMSFTIPQGFININKKMLITIGEKENAAMKKSYHQIIASNKYCEGIIIPDVGHGAPLAVPEIFNSIMENWINKNL